MTRILGTFRWFLNTIQTPISTSNSSPKFIQASNSQILVKSFLCTGICSRLDLRMDKAWSLKSYVHFLLAISTWMTHNLHLTHPEAPLPSSLAPVPVPGHHHPASCTSQTLGCYPRPAPTSPPCPMTPLRNILNLYANPLPSHHSSILGPHILPFAITTVLSLALIS